MHREVLRIDYITKNNNNNNKNSKKNFCALNRCIALTTHSYIIFYVHFFIV